jgi:hypothetical protein
MLPVRSFCPLVAVYQPVEVRILETLVKEKSQPSEKMTAPARQAPDRGAEIDELMRIKQRHKLDGNRVPCPCCGVVVEFTINRCPFCDSDIAAETALARETTRRLRELSGELDAEHAARRDGEEAPKKRGFFARLKYLFAGDPDPVDAPKVDPHAKRLLSNLAPGDSFKILAEDGPWIQVKTMGGEIGWVYSTVRENPSQRSR